jgi:hypothetical protein
MKPMNVFARRTLFAATALLAAGAASLPLTAATTPAAKAEPKPQLMFVQTSQTMTSDPATKTIRLVNVNPQSLYFADRPVRLAGHINMADYMKEWTSKAGKDNFGKDPPNATLSVFEAGKPDSTLTVVEISNPKMVGKDLVYSYKVIDGKVPRTGGETAIFIDWIGVGGGVGPGFHGVGVGRRGVGVR